MVTYKPQASDFQGHQLVELEFKYSSKAEGVLFYMQHNATKQGMVLHMKDNALHFSVNNGAETINVKSPVQLIAESWFKVGASRLVHLIEYSSLNEIKLSRLSDIIL